MPPSAGCPGRPALSKSGRAAPLPRRRLPLLVASQKDGKMVSCRRFRNPRTQRRYLAAMPSMIHEVFVDLFKYRPALAAEMLVEALDVSLPAYTGARWASADLTEIQPAEYRADVVVVLLAGDIVVRVVIVEVQLAADPRRRRGGPAYVTVSRAIHGCPADLLVVAADPNV